MVGEMLRLLTDSAVDTVEAQVKETVSGKKQKRQGIKEPVFHRSQLPELEDELDCWE